MPYGVIIDFGGSLGNLRGEGVMFLKRLFEPYRVEIIDEGSLGSGLSRAIYSLKGLPCFI